MTSILDERKSGWTTTAGAPLSKTEVLVHLHRMLVASYERINVLMRNLDTIVKHVDKLENEIISLRKDMEDLIDKTEPKRSEREK